MVCAVTFVGDYQWLKACDNVLTIVDFDKSDFIVNKRLSYFCLIKWFINWFRRITSNQQNSEGQ
jgi:hypothetical protein